MVELTITTKDKDEVVDISEQIKEAIATTNIQSGVCFVSALHTTCALTTADLDVGTDKDLLSFLRAIEPQLSYRHPHDPKHAPDHLLSSIIGTSLSIPIKHGKLYLGTWQRIILIELDGPRDRRVVCNVLATND